MAGSAGQQGPKTPRGASQGTCYLCNSTFSKRSMTRHVQSCRLLHPQPIRGRGAERTARLFHLAVEGRYQPGYWMHLEVPADAKLRVLDRFLRDVWLECCGHLSAFNVGEQTYCVGAFEPGDRTMNIALERVLSTGSVFSHEYDFGSTTELRLKVAGERSGVVKGTAVELLARNDPPLLSCQECGKPAAAVCTECSVEEGDAWLCKDCAAKHEDEEEMLLPVVNSPRVGTCGYTG